MQKYNDKNKDSNIDEFDCGKDYIKVKFFDGVIYTYTYSSAGAFHIETMKKLANAHNGLNSYINKNKPNYKSKIK